MARSRNIKPGFFENDLLAELDPLGRLLFIGMWTIADREGRMEDRPKKIKAQVLPYDECDVNSLLDGLATRGFILRYSIGKTWFIQVVNWKKHQQPHIKEGPSTIPAPDMHGANIVHALAEHGTSTEEAALIPDSLNLIPGTTPLSPQMGAPETQAAKKPRKRTPSQDCAPELLPLVAEVYHAAPLEHPITGEPVQKGPLAEAERAFQSCINEGIPADLLRMAGLVYYAAEVLEKRYPSALSRLPEAVNRVWDTRCKAMMHVSTFYGPKKRAYRQLLPLAQKVLDRITPKQAEIICEVPT
ncbi:MAG: hypothetical protein H6Q00_1645 [Holophagaceae bacterium]|nr:hypothetical protein [Holophagaceae bacterium]